MRQFVVEYKCPKSHRQARSKFPIAPAAPIPPKGCEVCERSMIAFHRELRPGEAIDE